MAGLRQAAQLKVSVVAAAMREIFPELLEIRQSNFFEAGVAHSPCPAGNQFKRFLHPVQAGFKKE
ncbi:MAG: hypothetical protein V7606_3973 [Burkholderiales bacterium]|jgi:hypothetical protein